MDWNKKVYPKDIWKWFKNKFNLSIFKHIFSIYHRSTKHIERKGGFTPRRSVSRIDRAKFDDRYSIFDTNEEWTINGIKRKPTDHERTLVNKSMDEVDKELEKVERVLNNMFKKNKKRKTKPVSGNFKDEIDNLHFAERTGIWDVNMPDIIEIKKSLRKLNK